MSIVRNQEQSLNPSPVVYLYQIDLSTARTPTNTTLFLSPYRNGTSNLSYGGQAYTYADIAMEGLTMELGGKLPDPRMTVLCRKGDVLLTQTISGDIRGARVTRIKTYALHLDSGASPNTSANRRSVMFINGIQTRVNTRIAFRLSPAYGLEGINDRANRSLAQDSCGLTYRVWNGSAFTYTPVRDGGCPWGNPAEQSNFSAVPDWGTLFFNTADQQVGTAAEDRCSKHATGCMARFSRANINQPIPIEADFRSGANAIRRC